MIVALSLERPLNDHLQALNYAALLSHGLLLCLNELPQMAVLLLRKTDVFCKLLVIVLESRKEGVHLLELLLI